MSKFMRKLLFKTRNWLLIKLAHGSSIAINAKISGERVAITSLDNSLVHNCHFTRLKQGLTDRPEPEKQP